MTRHELDGHDRQLVASCLLCVVDDLRARLAAAERVLKLSEEALDERTKFYRSLAARLESSRDSADQAAEIRSQGERVAWDAVVEERQRNDYLAARLATLETVVAAYREAARQVSPTFDARASASTRVIAFNLTECLSPLRTPRTQD